MIKVAIVDDHPLILEGVVKILEGEPDMKVVAQAENVSGLLALTENTEPDLLILDISLPGRSGLDALAEIRKTRPQLPVLVLSMHPEDRYALRALKAGASGYVTKASAAEELLGAVRRVISGGRYVSRAVAEMLADDLARPLEKPPHERLSDREFQILGMIAKGKAIKEIAAEISLSVNTVNTYRARILDKMEMRSNADLIRYAIEHKLLD
jgi:two-component system invasion response regulator UvrY